MSAYWNHKRICVTGGAGFLGRVVCRLLRDQGAEHVMVPRSSDYDLTCADGVARLFQDAVPDVVIHLAAEVGGIGANRKQPGRFFYANMAMGLHLIEQARASGIEKFVQIGTVCAYPKHCKTPFREDDLWEGYPEETNAAYGVAKRSLGVMLEAYRAEYDLNGLFLIPVNLYGPGDDFDLESSHVIPALIRKFSDAVRLGHSSVTCWGNGEVSREFLHVEDAAEGIVTAAAIHNDSKPVNLGTGREIAIAELASLIADLTGFRGDIEWDDSKPSGQPRRQLDTSKANTLFGWMPKIELEEGLRQTIDWWQQQQASLQIANN